MITSDEESSCEREEWSDKESALKELVKNSVRDSLKQFIQMECLRKSKQSDKIKVEDGEVE